MTTVREDNQSQGLPKIFCFVRADKKITVNASSIDQAEHKLYSMSLAAWTFTLFSITKPKGYHALCVHQRINAKGNAGLLYTGYKPSTFHMMERPAEARLILKRISKRDPGCFTPDMLLNQNTKFI